MYRAVYVIALCLVVNAGALTSPLASPRIIRLTCDGTKIFPSPPNSPRATLPVKQLRITVNLTDGSVATSKDNGNLPMHIHHNDPNSSELTFGDPDPGLTFGSLQKYPHPHRAGTIDRVTGRTTIITQTKLPPVGPEEILELICR